MIDHKYYEKTPLARLVEYARKSYKKVRHLDIVAFLNEKPKKKRKSRAA